MSATEVLEIAADRPDITTPYCAVVNHVAECRDDDKWYFDTCVHIYSLAGATPLIDDPELASEEELELKPQHVLGLRISTNSHESLDDDVVLRVAAEALHRRRIIEAAQLEQIDEVIRLYGTPQYIGAESMYRARNCFGHTVGYCTYHCVWEDD